MRTRDDNKERAIFEATVSLAIDEGLQGISMSKIAKRANLSAATIYIYYKNKDDLIKKIYLAIKIQLSEYMKFNLSLEQTSEEMFGQLMENIYKFMRNHLTYLLFMEACLMNAGIARDNTVDYMFEPVFKCFEQGVEKNELKNLSLYQLVLYCYLPIVQLGKDHMKNGEINIEEKFEEIKILSWAAIKK